MFSLLLQWTVGLLTKQLLPNLFTNKTLAGIAIFADRSKIVDLRIFSFLESRLEGSNLYAQKQIRPRAGFAH